MRVVAVIQARFSSQRLPGKVLKPMHGRPMLGWLIEALRHAEGVDALVVATSLETSDDPVAKFAAQNDLDCWRGSLNDVAGRMTGAARNARADALVRVNGDSPLLDPALVATGIRQFRAGSYDLVTNVLPRTFPKGQSVEVISLPRLEATIEQMKQASEREHVTQYFYRHPESFAIGRFTADPAKPELQLSVDTNEDFQLAEAILARLPVPHWVAGWQQIAQLAEELA